MISARFIRDIDGRDGLFNMAADAWLADSFTEKGVPAVFRVYTWDPTAVSLGFNQKEGVVDVRGCRERGWEVVRRPTGGRALLHEGDLSYSIVAPASKAPFADLRRIYDGMAEALIRVLARGGIEADNGRISTRHPLNDPSPRARLCMGSRSRGEVLVGGRKISSAAQRVFKDYILQHGSIPLRGDISAIAQVAAVPAAARFEAAEMLRREAATLQDVGFPFLEPSDVAKMFVEEIQRQFSFELTERNWTESEEREILSRMETYKVKACAPAAAAYV